MKKLNGRFTTIPNKLITAKDLSGSEFKVLCYLCMLSDKQNISFPSYEYLHDNMGLAVSTIKLAVKTLAQKDYLRRIRRIKSNGCYNSNQYVLTEKVFEDG